MLIYLLLIASVLVLGFLFSKNHRKFFIVCICIMMSIIAGLRHYTIGNDTDDYLRTYNVVARNGMDTVGISRMEPGYIITNLLFTNIGADFNLYLFFASLFINLAIAYLIMKKSKNPVGSFLLFILFRFFFNEMNILRQFLSISLILYGLPFIEERKFLKYLAMVFLATSIHVSALVTIILYFLYREHYKKMTIICMIIGTIVVSVLLGGILNALTSRIGLYGGYVENFMDSNKLGSFLHFAVFLAEYVYCRRVYRLYGENNIDNKYPGFLLNIMFLCALLSVLAIRISIMSRLIEYFSIFMIISVPFFTELIPNKKRKMAAWIIILLLASLYFTSITYYRPNWNNVVPYRFCWEEVV